MEGVQPFSWGDAVPVERKAPRLIRVPAAKPLKGWVVCDRLWKIATHWDGERSRLCTGDDCECRTRPVRPARTYYLIALYQTFEECSVWVQLTPEAVRSLQARYPDFASLLGREVEIGRTKKTFNAPVYVEVLNVYVTARNFGKPLEPHDTLQRCFYGERSTGEE
jgi:hypothetical protein